MLKALISSRFGKNSSDAEGGVVLRYGQFYGPGTYNEQQQPPLVCLAERRREICPKKALRCPTIESRTVITTLPRYGLQARP
jgi:hypothetical protein